MSIKCTLFPSSPRPTAILCLTLPASSCTKLSETFLGPRPPRAFPRRLSSVPRGASEPGNFEARRFRRQSFQPDSRIIRARIYGVFQNYRGRDSDGEAREQRSSSSSRVIRDPSFFSRQRQHLSAVPIHIVDARRAIRMHPLMEQISELARISVSNLKDRI